LRTKVRTTGAMLAGFLLLAACSAPDDNGGTEQVDGQPSPSVTPSPAATPSPTLGGKLETPAKAPAKEMDKLERPIASQLEKRITGNGLSLDYLDCPDWNGKAPQELACEGYVSGVRGEVRVRLTRTATSVNYDAELQDGVLATANLVRQLKTAGYTKIDCGDKPAYPTVVGSELVCAVGKDGNVKYVVATVLDESGMVEIKDY